MGTVGKFKDWMRNAGIQWDDSLIEIRGGSVGTLEPGWGVFAKVGLQEGSRLCVIPKTAVLSIVTSSIAEIIDVERLRGGLGLVLAVAVEKAKGSQSFWWGYFQSMPKREYLPLFWTDEELSGLKGTDIQNRAQEDRFLTEEDYNESIAPLLKKYPNDLKNLKITLEDFQEAGSLVASRAFFVDDEHGQAMVPLADIFNHKASIVALSDEYGIEGHGGDESSMSEEDCDADEEEKSAEENGAKIATTLDSENPNNETQHSFSAATKCKPLDDDKVMPKSLGISAKPAVHGSSLPADPALRLQIGICSAETDGNEAVLEIVVASKVENGEEVHNTYGELSNSELLAKYGFALQSNPFNSVQVDKGIFLQKAEETLGTKHTRRRIKFLNKHSYLLSEEDEPFEIFPGGCVCPAITAALRVLTASKVEFRAWQSVDDIRNADSQVFESIQPLGKLCETIGLDGLLCLKRVLDERCSQYATKDVQQDKQSLSLLMAKSRSNSSCAQIGCCVLRISEREILSELIQEVEGGIQGLVTKDIQTAKAIQDKSRKRKTQLTNSILG